MLPEALHKGLALDELTHVERFRVTCTLPLLDLFSSCSVFSASSPVFLLNFLCCMSLLALLSITLALSLRSCFPCRLPNPSATLKDSSGYRHKCHSYEN